ncbi:uncharacterized protein BDR25DRAFT_318961 [Lindgomyces ingoldianus]|uniref:Uncharacterized protein n=1 Tax=Lindgomyces ingoldianus TaxID=673940 RepID=A0ACB6QCN6_9PLEO|nr:uncharacterized protein BDR25DRAFT_318961 [Lindgomyces ingoldianus]KAF2464694.1 hypothetical protein BDR25DRAFT_318961 [Lindgomyces ingoldianus]
MQTVRGSPVKPEKVLASVWDADEDEFDRWPVQDQFVARLLRTPTERGNSNEYAKQLEMSTVNRYLSVYGSFHRQATTTQRGSSLGVYGSSGDWHEEESTEDPEAYEAQATIMELQDPESGHVIGGDKNDELMSQFFSGRYRSLPPTTPARHMHVVEAQDFIETEDRVVLSVRPRLCDGVATVLFKTSPNCLDAFLNPQVKVFEWRRDVTRPRNHCLSGVIRRVGNEVLCRWAYYVKSTIDFSGKWSEIYANVGTGTTKRTSTGPALDEFEPSNPPPDGVSPTDPLYTLFAGRDLSRYMLNYEFWDFIECKGMVVEWEVDGIISKGTMKRRTNEGRNDEAGNDE